MTGIEGIARVNTMYPAGGEASLFGTYVRPVHLDETTPIALFIERRTVEDIEIYVFARRFLVDDSKKKELCASVAQLVQLQEVPIGEIALDQLEAAQVDSLVIWGERSEVRANILSRACSNLNKGKLHWMEKLARIMLEPDGDGPE